MDNNEICALNAAIVDQAGCTNLIQFKNILDEEEMDSSAYSIWTEYVHDKVMGFYDYVNNRSTSMPFFLCICEHGHANLWFCILFFLLTFLSIFYICL